MQIYKKIKYILLYIQFVFGILFLFFLFLFTNSQEKLWKLRQKFSKFQRYMFGYEIQIQGQIKDVNMIMINHQSMLDIMALEDFYPKNLTWIAKIELSKLPFFGTIMKKPNFICINRNDPKSLIKLLKQAKQNIQENRVLAIFPEGTRSKGEKLLKFQSGAKIIAQKLNLKVQPILIVDSAKILDTQNFTCNKGILKIIFMDLVDLNDEKWLENTRAKMQELLDKERLNA